MPSLDTLPDGWEVWNYEEGGRVILAYRPDVFDSNQYPPACLPTITVGPGDSPDRPPERRARGGRWHAVLYLEPSVRARRHDADCDTRDEAVEAAIRLAQQFVDGGIDYREPYQLTREQYMKQLDELVGREH